MFFYWVRGSSRHMDTPTGVPSPPVYSTSDQEYEKKLVYYHVKLLEKEKPYRFFFKKGEAISLVTVAVPTRSSTPVAQLERCTR
jgi:hypothetical protein